MRTIKRRFTTPFGSLGFIINTENNFRIKGKSKKSEIERMFTEQFMFRINEMYHKKYKKSYIPQELIEILGSNYETTKE
jgi:hypothetical protein